MTVLPESALEQRPHRTSDATIARGRQRREEIVTAATELFAQNGYRGTGLLAIAAKVGVTQPTLMHHFGSKQGLLHAVIERRHAQDMAELELLLRAGLSSPLDVLPRLATHLRERAGLAHLFAVLVAENLLPDHPAHDWFVERYRTTRTVVATALREGQSRGDVKADADVADVALRLLAVLDGVQTQWLLDPDTVDLDAAFNSVAVAFRAELQP